jgi:uncharacterized protein YbjT (DUF2867 family)
MLEIAMVWNNGSILVFGATGQQGGSVARALAANGWHVKALVRDMTADKAKMLAAMGIELMAGDFKDAPSISAAMAGVHGVFSVQPSSGQGAAYGMSDADEVRYGKMVADLSMASGVQHLVYRSANAAGPTKSGVGHFDSKSEIEAHISTLDMQNTVIRPSAFMEMLALPGLGLETGDVAFFMRPDQPMQFIAVADIGKIVATNFSDPAAYASRTIEIAGDAVTGAELAEKFSRAACRPIAYHRFPDSLLKDNAFLGGLAALVDEGRLAGGADIRALHREFSDLLSMDEWLAGVGKPAFEAALRSQSDELALR